MVSGTGDNPPFRDNFTERLYENCVTETKLTLLNYAPILASSKIRIIILSFFLSSSFLLSCVFTFRKWTDNLNGAVIYS